MNVSIYCDGSGTTGNLSGGWAFVVLVDGVKVAEGSGHLSKATNNVAELTAAISGIEFVKNEPRFAGATSIELVSDSQLTLKYASGEYKCKKPHLVPLYCKLRQLYKSLNLKTRWVKGHSGEEHNERCDALAGDARAGQIVTPSCLVNSATALYEDVLQVGDHD